MFGVERASKSGDNSYRKCNILFSKYYKRFIIKYSYGNCQGFLRKSLKIQLPLRPNRCLFNHKSLQFLEFSKTL